MFAKRKWTSVVAVCLGLSAWSAGAARLPHDQYQLDLPTAALHYPALANEKLLKEDQAAKPGPARYAIAREASAKLHAGGKSAVGQWRDLSDGNSLWQLRVKAEQAVSLDFGFRDFFLPQGANLYVADAKGQIIRGPYTDADNPRSGEFWTPVVPGGDAVIELTVPTSRKSLVQFELMQVHQGYRDIFNARPSAAKSGTCNVDTVCNEGNNYREQINAVAMYTVSGGSCTGQLINNTAQDRKRYFITANHCINSQSAANGVVVYWKYESPACRTVGSSSNGVPTSLSVAIEQTGGTSLRATHLDSDNTLVELNSAIPSTANPFWLGWDRSESTKSSALVIHHPAGDEKRISFENNSVSIFNGASEISGISGTKFWQVNDWDLGTTEGGSSGSGLLSPEKRLIGVLSGGGAACGNDLLDRFGRFSSAWEGGGSASTRHKDWLDPSGQNPITLDGRGTCNAPILNLSVPASANAGETVNLSVTISGGSGSYPKIEFDVDGDGVYDRTGTTTSLNTKYPRTVSVNVGVRVTDSAGCSATTQRALNVQGTDVVATASAAQQTCGDGDTAIEPGEHWRVPVSLFNAGAQSVGNGHAIFTRGFSNERPGLIASGGGYEIYSNASNAAACPFEFVDISTTGTAIPFSSADDDLSDPISLGPTNLNLFGTAMPQVRVSTNGYIAPLNDSDDNFANVCGLGTLNQGGTRPRLQILHDDLYLPNTASSVRYRYFSLCPRAVDAGVAQGCTVFQWSNVQRIVAGTGGATTEGNFTFQAIVYDNNGQIVYQYRDADPQRGGSATISVLGANNGVGLEYACNEQDSAPANRSVCFFNTNVASPLTFQSAKIKISTPAFALNNLSSGQTSNSSVNFEVDRAAVCRNSIKLRYVGTVDTKVASMRGAEVLNTNVGSGSNCQVFNGCASTALQNIAPDSGLFANPERFGNGVGHYVIPVAGADPVVFGAWFTGDAQRQTAWYIVQGNLDYFQVNAPLYRSNGYACPTCSPALPVAPALSVVGDAQLTYLNSTEYVMTWSLNGTAMGERQSVLYPGANSNPNRTGAWYYPQEAGWGVILDDHLLNGTPDQVNINFIFDAANNPRWTLGAQGVNGGTAEQASFQVHCPHCPTLPDFPVTRAVLGSQTVNWSGLGNGTLSTTIAYPAPLTGTFNRNAVPIQILTPLPPQGSAANESP